jgi:hypothetical protein
MAVKASRHVEFFNYVERRVMIRGRASPSDLNYPSSSVNFALS